MNYLRDFTRYTLFFINTVPYYSLSVRAIIRLMQCIFTDEAVVVYAVNNALEKRRR